MANSLSFLSESLFASKDLSQRLADLAGQYRSENAPAQFEELKRQTQDLLLELQDSILFSDQTENGDV